MKLRRVCHRWIGFLGAGLAVNWALFCGYELLLVALLVLAEQQQQASLLIGALCVAVSVL